METDWTYQWQHEQSKYEKEPKPKYEHGDVVWYEDELVTITRVRQTSKNTFTYDIKEYPFMFVFEYELTANRNEKNNG